MNILKKNFCNFFLLGVFSVILSSNVYGQIIISETDSLYFESIKNDTTKLRQLTNRLGSALAVKAHYRLGFLEFKARRYKSSESDYRTLRRISPNSTEGKEALYFLGRLESFKDSIQASRKFYEGYLKEDIDGHWAEGAKYFLILQMMKLKDQNSIVKMREFLTEYPPDSTYSNHVQYQIVQFYRIHEDYVNAALEAKKLVETYPNSAYTRDISYQIGGFLYKAGKSEQAKAYFRKIAHDNPPNTEPSAIGQYLLAELYDRSGEYENARAEYKKVKTNNPNVSNWAVLSDYAVAMSYYNESMEIKDTSNTKPDSSKLSMAENMFEKFIKDYPTDKRTPRAAMTLAEIYNFNEEWEKALDAYNKIISFDADNMTNVSEDYMEKEIEAHKKLVENARFSKALLLRKMNTENNKQALPEALKEYEIILNENPDRLDAMLGKAITLLDMQRTGEALPILESLSKEGAPEAEAAKSILENFTPLLRPLDFGGRAKETLKGGN